MLVHLLIKFVNKLSNIFKVVEFITSDMQTIITQYLVTVDLFFSNICRGVIGIPCTRLRHNCIVNNGTLFSKICITMAVSVASQRR